MLVVWRASQGECYEAVMRCRRMHAVAAGVDLISNGSSSIALTQSDSRAVAVSECLPMSAASVVTPLDLCRVHYQFRLIATSLLCTCIVSLHFLQGTMPGERRRGRPRTAWMDNIKTWTGLSAEESVRMTEDRDKWRKYVHGVANPRIEDG